MANIFPLELPPGLWRNGTQYQARGRWYDANLVRWRNNSMRPIGGWDLWGASNTIAGIARGAHSWTDNAGDRWLAFGTAAKLYVYNDSTTLFDITPLTGYVTGAVDATRAGGYGEGAYGLGSYGTPRPDTLAVTLASTWALDSWGQYLVGCCDGDGDIWEWKLGTGTKAAQVLNAPTSCIGLVVTSERFLMALGNGGNPRSIAWCDQGANTVWAAAATNQAGDFLLETDGEIRCGIKLRGETLILTSTDLWAARYIGTPLVYSFQKVGSGCGAPGNRCAVKLDNAAMWLGNGGFYHYSGVVRKVQCDVWDDFVDSTSESQLSKTFAWHNVEHSEVWWLVPGETTNECSLAYVYNYNEDHWTKHVIARSCGVAKGTFITPILMGTDGQPYQHENGFYHGGATAYAESGPVELGSGERRVHATRMWPDEQTLGDVTATFKTREYPTGTESSYGPYTMAEPTSIRFSGRQAVLRVTAAVSTDWRVGVPRIEFTAGGKR